MNEIKEKKEELTLGELKIWLKGEFAVVGEKFKTVGAEFDSVNRRFTMLMWAGVLIVAVLIGVQFFENGKINRLEDSMNTKMDKLEALILKNRDEIALNGKAIEVNKVLIEEAKCQCEPKISK